MNAPSTEPTDTQASLSVAIVEQLRAQVGSLPSAVRKKIALHALDAVAIGVAARSTHIATDVYQAMTAGMGSNGPAQVMGGGSLPALAAAFVNASLIHVLDYDDIHDRGRLHPGAVILPAVLAAADTVNASEKRVTEALAIGSELVCRLAVACAPEGSGPGSAWFLTQLFGYIGASLAAAHVLDLSDDDCASAIGLAYMQAAGGKQAGFGTGANARAIYPAFAAQGGLQAAFLAQAGIRGPLGALNGDADLFRIYLGHPLSPEGRQLLLNGTAWHLNDVAIKVWPSCRLSHPYIAVALQARETVQAHPSADIVLSVNASAARLCRPIEQRRVPLTLQDAKYSLPFMTAYALVHGAPTLQTLNDQSLRDENVMHMAQRVTIVETLPDNPGHPGAVLSVQEHGRTVSTHRFDDTLIEFDDTALQTKFLNCFEVAGLSERASLVWDTATHGDIRKAMQLACA